MSAPDYAGLLSELRKVQWRTAIGPKHHGILIERSADAIEQLSARVADADAAVRASAGYQALLEKDREDLRARIAALEAEARQSARQADMAYHTWEQGFKDGQHAASKDRNSIP